MRNKQIIKFFTFALLLQAITFSTFAQKSVELKYKLTEGDTYDYVMLLDQDIVFEANGQTMALDMTMTFEMTQKVVSVSSDSIKLEGQTKRVLSKQAIFGMEVTYDTDNPVDNPMTAQLAQQFSSMLNKPFYMNMDHQGRFGDMDFSTISDSEELADNLNSGSQFVIYPKGKIKVGDTWEEDINPTETSDMKFHAKYTLLKVSGKTATIGVEGVITANEVEDLEIKLDGTMKGEIIVDTKTGWLIESKIDQDLELEIDQNGMKFPATTTGTIVTTSAKAN